MNRRRFLLSLAGAFAAPLGADAQEAGKVYRIGYLASGAAPQADGEPRLGSITPEFRDGLREFGWAEGRNIVVDYRSAEGKFDRLPALAAEMIRLKADVIVTSATPAALIASKATKTIPIVIVGVGDPVGLGLVTSLAHPGGNITGLSYSVGVETFGKSLELLKEAVPKIRRVAVLSNPANPAHSLAVGNVKAAARSSAVELQLLEARGPEQFDAVFATMAKERAEAVLVLADSMFLLHRARLADLVAKNRLPTMHGFKAILKPGGLMSYGPSNDVAGRRVAYFVDKILRGAKPADLPIEQPTNFELVINLKTAKALGLTIPPSLLARADEVIE